MTNSTVTLTVQQNDAWTRISLSDGQAITHSEGGANEEGFAYREITWARKFDWVSADLHIWGVDSEGPHSIRKLFECHVSYLESETLENNVRIPAWEICV